MFWIDGRLRQVVSHRGYLFTVFIYQLFWTQAFPEGMYTNGTQVPCEVPSALNPTTRKGWPHHRGRYDPYSFRIVMWVLLRPTRTNHWKCCETGPTVFRPYPRRLESLTICSCHYKGSTSFLVIWRPWASVGPVGVWTRGLPLGRPVLSQFHCSSSLLPTDSVLPYSIEIGNKWRQSVVKTRNSTTLFSWASV